MLYDNYESVGQLRENIHKMSVTKHMLRNMSSKNFKDKVRIERIRLMRLYKDNIYGG